MGRLGCGQMAVVILVIGTAIWMLVITGRGGRSSSQDVVRSVGVGRRR